MTYPNHPDICLFGPPLILISSDNRSSFVPTLKNDFYGFFFRKKQSDNYDQMQSCKSLVPIRYLIHLQQKRRLFLREFEYSVNKINRVLKQTFIKKNVQNIF